MNVTIVADQGTHLLIANGSRYAVIERRNDQVYNCHDGRRQGIPAGDLSAVDKVLDARDWTDQETARTTFEKMVARGDQLAQGMR